VAGGDAIAGAVDGEAARDASSSASGSWGGAEPDLLDRAELRRGGRTILDIDLPAHTAAAAPRR